MMNNLKQLIKDEIDIGCFDMSDSLGIKKMPEGYALMLNPDRTHFYWVRYDGVDSTIHWNKWAVYLGAVEDKNRHESMSK